jgi:hypothetical protein
MKCPKCNYVSHDYLDDCRKCGIDLVPFKQDIGLLVLQPGVLDLSLVLGGAGADDLFESVEEGVTMHASQGDRILIPCNDVDWRLESDLITGSEVVDQCSTLLLLLEI